MTYTDGEPVASVQPRPHTTLVGEAADLPHNHLLVPTATSMAAYAKLLASNELPALTGTDAEHGTPAPPSSTCRNCAANG